NVAHHPIASEYTTLRCKDKKNFDNSLAELYLAGPDSDFIAFCGDVLRRFPVAENLLSAVNEYAECLADAMVLYSGYRAEEIGDDACDVAVMKNREITSGIWCSLDADEDKLSDLIAGKVSDAIQSAGASESDTDRLTICIGLYCYAAAFCVPSFDAKSFRRLFVLAWFKYFSTVLTLENNAAPAGKGFIS
ncbi:MAG: hypothetical protein ACI3ZT_06510, partial [Candidatus Cryptobacteroides sp.]